MNPVEAMELLINRMGRTKSNTEFLKTLNLA
jgi:transcription termination factor Rho